MKKLHCLILLTSSICLASCSMMPDWFGDSPTPKLEGKRTAVFSLEGKIKPDAALDKTPVVIPAQGEAGHLRLASDISKHGEISIGEGTDEDYNLEAKPLIDGNTLYTLDAKGNVSAYMANIIQERLWKTNILTEKKKLFAGGGLAAAAGKLFVTVGSEEVVALDAASGKILWRRAVGNVLRTAPFAVSNALFVQTLDNHVYAIDSKDGRVVWSHAGALETLGIFGSASPTVAGNLLLVPYSSGELYALNPLSGQEIWSGNLTRNQMSNTGFSLNDIDAPLTVAGNTLYTAGNAGLLYAVNITTGQRLWYQETGTLRGLWAAGQFLFGISATNEVVCLQAKDGAIKWVMQLPGYKNEKQKKGPIVMSGPVLAGERLWIVASNGILYSLSPYDGKIIHKTKVPENITLPPVVAKEAMYLLNNKAKLVALH